MAKNIASKKVKKKTAKTIPLAKKRSAPARSAAATHMSAPAAAQPTPASPVSAKVADGYAVFIMGEGPLVGEYAELCSSRGIHVTVRWDDPAAPGTLSRKYKSASAPPKGTAFAIELTNLDLDRKRTNIRLLDGALPPGIPILTSSVTVSATEQAGWISDRSRLIGIGALPSLSSRPLVEVAPTIYSPAATVDAIARLFRALGKDIEIVQDRVGLVFPRVICRMINEAAFALAEEVSTPSDMDTAVRLALSHPRGPIEWTERLGLSQVAAVLAALERETGDPRYRTAPLLRQLALAGEWWKR
jgi:3-hydroxybutyryl-CoA dehydrogenase